MFRSRPQGVRMFRSRPQGVRYVLSADVEAAREHKLVYLHWMGSSTAGWRCSCGQHAVVNGSTYSTLSECERIAATSWARHAYERVQ